MVNQSVSDRPSTPKLPAPLKAFTRRAVATLRRSPGIRALGSTTMTGVRAVMPKRLAGGQRAESFNEDLGASLSSAVADHPGLLIIRTWIEPGSSEPFRANIRLTTDVSGGFERSLTLAGAEDVLATVEEWLAACQRKAGSAVALSAGEQWTERGRNGSPRRLPAG